MRHLVSMGLVSMMLLGLSACGFQLRGPVDWPEEMRQMQIEVADRTTPLMRALTAQLRANGVRVDGEYANPPSRLVIERQWLDQQALTISQDARVREYVLHLEVRYSLYDATGEPIIQNDSVRISRDYRFDEQSILGATREREFLAEEMARSLAAQLVRQWSIELKSGS